MWEEFDDMSEAQRPIKLFYSYAQALEPLPTNRKPITSWSNQDEALLDGALGIRRAVETFKTLPAGQVQQEVKQLEQQPTNQSPSINGLDRPATVFLSYAHEDTEQVRDLQLRLNVRGVRCWRDVDNMLTGSQFEHEIVQAIEHEADAIALVFREVTRITLLLEEQKETWSTETHPSEKDPLRKEWIYDDHGDQQQAVIEVATSRSTTQSVAETLSVIGLTPAYHIRLESLEFSRESVRDAAHARAIAQQVAQLCQNLCDERGVRHLHLFLATPVELAVLIGQ
jgi:SMODS-associated and fused to various effectors sensor domain/TIR domain